MAGHKEYLRLEYTERVCLKCNKKFQSHGPGNRICDPCKNRNLTEKDHTVRNELYHIRNRFYEIL